MTLLARYTDIIALLLALSALGIALLSQYGFGTHPCDLCILQRYPYIVAAIAAAIALMIKHKAILRFITVSAFLTTAGIACYHVAVEQGWVAGPDSCSSGARISGSLDAIKDSILNAPLVSCADIGASFLGVSMASWNALYATFCAIMLGYIYITKRAHNE